MVGEPRKPMDAFLTPGQKALRQKIRAYFLGANPAPAELPAWLTTAAAGGFLERALAIEETTAVSPSLGRPLAEDGAAGSGPSGAEKAVVEIARSLGTASATLETCFRAAREKGLFDSVLLDHQKAQSGLAEVYSGLEAARALAYRAFILLDRGETARAEKEMGPAAVRAARISEAARDLAFALLGPGGGAGAVDHFERRRS
jgi:hypothetical protein